MEYKLEKEYKLQKRESNKLQHCYLSILYYNLYFLSFVLKVYV